MAIISNTNSGACARSCVLGLVMVISGAPYYKHPNLDSYLWSLRVACSQWTGIVVSEYGVCKISRFTDKDDNLREGWR